MFTTPRTPWQDASVPVVPREQLSGIWRQSFLPPRQSDCYGHDADDGIRGTCIVPKSGNRCSDKIMRMENSS